MGAKRTRSDGFKKDTLVTGPCTRKFGQRNDRRNKRSLSAYRIWCQESLNKNMTRDSQYKRYSQSQIDGASIKLRMSGKGRLTTSDDPST